jgi:archaellum component FlaC
MLGMRVLKNVAIYLLLGLLCLGILSVGTPVYGWLQRTIHRDFHWTYNWIEWRWSLDIPVDYYIAYAVVPLGERLREGQRLWGTLVTTDDQYLKGLAGALKSLASQEGYGYYDTANFILAFVQSLPYIPDDVSTPYDEFPKFPLETLIEGGGDCEDTSILYATLLKIVGYDVILVSPPGHMMVGVAEYRDQPLAGGWYVEFNGIRYYLAETTGEGWRIGDAPEEFRGVTVKVAVITGEQLRPKPVDIPKLIEEHKVLQQKYDQIYQSYQNLSNKYRDVEEKYGTLNEEYNSLKDRYNELQSSYQTLSSKYEHLSSLYNELQTSYQNLSSEHESLKSSFEQLSTRYSQLQTNYSSLRMEYDRISSQFQELGEKYQSLKGQYDDLNMRYQKLSLDLSSTTFALNVYRLLFFVMVIIALIMIVALMRSGRRSKYHGSSQMS